MGNKVNAWIKATRPQTLPVSVAGVFAGTGCAALYGSFRWLPALICLLFAIVAQVASNFANEYYDYAYGLDKKGREGFRRGVTEGDITPRAMFRALWTLIAIDCLLGLTLLYWGGAWLLLPGIAIAIFAVGYSAGPYPLSHHGLGDVAVFIFFGLVPVTLTCLVQVGAWEWSSVSIPVGAAIGLMSANVLIVNNYRDADDDRAVGKHTTVVLFGRRTMYRAYLLSGLVADGLTLAFTPERTGWWIALPCGVYLVAHLLIWHRIGHMKGKALNPMLGMTACNLLLFALLLALVYSLLG